MLGMWEFALARVYAPRLYGLQTTGFTMCGINAPRSRIANRGANSLRAQPDLKNVCSVSSWRGA
jgi:hypothetical protein